MIARKAERVPGGPMLPGDGGTAFGADLVDVEVRKVSPSVWTAAKPGEPLATVRESSDARRGYSGPEWAVDAVLNVEQQYDREDEPFTWEGWEAADGW